MKKAREKAPSLKVLKSAVDEAARASGKILLRNFGGKLRIREKKGAGLVTQVDLASERAAMRILRDAYPDFGALTEETSPDQKKSAHFAGRWILDPLDGTTNYVHGFPMFCVSIAAEWQGQVVAGAIYHPVLDEMYLAVRGKGATLNGRPLRVSSTKKLTDSLLTTGFTYRKDEWLHLEMEAFERLSATARAIRRPGSAALDLAYVARGVFDGFWERRLSPWDIAAGALLVEEAGGRVTDFRNNPFRVSDAEILATNGKLHAPLLETVQTDYCPI